MFLDRAEVICNRLSGRFQKDTTSFLSKQLSYQIPIINTQKYFSYNHIFTDSCRFQNTARQFAKFPRT